MLAPYEHDWAMSWPRSVHAAVRSPTPGHARCRSSAATLS